MLINVFGNWINPAFIQGIVGVSGAGSKLQIDGDWYVYIDEKCPDEVAAEINRQIKESK